MFQTNQVLYGSHVASRADEKILSSYLEHVLDAFGLPRPSEGFINGQFFFLCLLSIINYSSVSSEEFSCHFTFFDQRSPFASFSNGQVRAVLYILQRW
jgi:hypothetical protein